MSELPLESEIRTHAPVSPAQPQIPAEPVTLADVSPQQQAADRYEAAINALVRDAVANQSLPILADIMASRLAMIALTCGAWVTGDILRRFGNHLVGLVEAERAQAEAERAREAGGLPN